MCRSEKDDFKLLKKFYMQKMWIECGEAVEQEVKLCDVVETVRESTYLGDRLSAGGGCDAAVTARTRYGWVKIRECGKLLYGGRFPPMQKVAVDKSYVRPAILYGSEAWSLKER